MKTHSLVGYICLTANSASLSISRVSCFVAVFLLLAVWEVAAISPPPLPDVSRKFDTAGGLSQAHEAYVLFSNNYSIDALAQLEELASKGNPYALFALGRYYAGAYGWTSKDFKRDPDKARSLFTKAIESLSRLANEGEPFAQFLYARAFGSAWGVPKDLAAAAKWYLKAAELNYAPAQFGIAEALMNGAGVARDEPLGTIWLRKSAEQDYAPAQNQLAVSLSNGAGVPKDEASAVAWFRKAAEQDYIPAQYQLGWALMNGVGVPKDEASAVVWFRKAAEEAYVPAQYALAVALMKGVGIPKDEAVAVTWHRRAAEQGDADAQYELAQALFSGTGIAQDREAAKIWYREAAKQGHREAKFKDLSQSGDLSQAIQANFAHFPLLARQQNSSNRPAWQTVSLNKDPLILQGLRFSGFRFVYTAKDGEDFLWAAKLPANVSRWYIEPESGTMDRPFKSFIRPSSGDTIYQAAQGRNFKAGSSYVIWFLFEDDEATPISLSFTFDRIKFDENSGVEDDGGKMQELLGTPNAD